MSIESEALVVDITADLGSEDDPAPETEDVVPGTTAASAETVPPETTAERSTTSMIPTTGTARHRDDQSTVTRTPEPQPTTEQTIDYSRPCQTVPTTVPGDWYCDGYEPD